jgi:hypothetical protein
MPDVPFSTEAGQDLRSSTRTPTRPGLPDVALVTQLRNSCEAALAELRSFRVSEQSLQALSQHVAVQPTARNSCQAIYLAARMLYTEQMKASLDLDLEDEIQAGISQLQGVPEAEMLRHALSIVSAYSGPDALKSAADFFHSEFVRLGSRDKLRHMEVLSALARLRATQREAQQGPEVASMAQEFSRLIGPIDSFVVRHVAAQMGVPARS